MTNENKQSYKTVETGHSHSYRQTVTLSSPTSPINQRDIAQSTSSSGNKVPPPIPPKRFRYKVSGSPSAGRHQSYWHSPGSPVSAVGPPLPEKRARTSPKFNNGLGSSDVTFGTAEPKSDTSNDKGLVSRDLDTKMLASRTLPRKLAKHDSLEKLRENSSVKQRIKDLALDLEPHSVSLRNQPLSPQERETKSLNRRAKLSIKVDDYDEDTVRPFVLSPILSSPSASKLMQKRKSGKSRSSSKRKSVKSPDKGKEQNSMMNPQKPVKPSRHTLTKIFRDNYYRFSGFLLERKATETLKRANSQPKLHSIFAFDLECAIGLKRWHSAECLGLEFCPTSKNQFEASKHDFLRVKFRNKSEGRLKKLARSQKAFTIHEGELSSYPHLDSSDSTIHSDPLFQHEHQRFGYASDTTKPKRTFSKSVTNLLSPGLSKKTRKESWSSQECEKNSGSSKRDRFGSLSSSSFANLLNFLTPKDK